MQYLFLFTLENSESDTFAACWHSIAVNRWELEFFPFSWICADTALINSAGCQIFRRGVTNVLIDYPRRDKVDDRHLLGLSPAVQTGVGSLAKPQAPQGGKPDEDASARLEVQTVTGTHQVDHP